MATVSPSQESRARSPASASAASADRRPASSARPPATSTSSPAGPAVTVSRSTLDRDAPIPVSRASTGRAARISGRTTRQPSASTSVSERRP
jgi:hypothetical protein